MRSVKEVLSSPAFKREVSILLIANAIFIGLCSVVMLARPSNLEVATTAVLAIILAIIYFVLAIVIRRGSTKALMAVGVFFVLDTLLIFTMPLEQSTAGMLFWRVFLIALLVRYIRKHRALTA